MRLAAFPTAFIKYEENRNGIMPPINKPINTVGFSMSILFRWVASVKAAKRASAVKEQLVASGLPEAVVSTKGLGPANPLADNGSPEGRRQNRRVEIEITVDESKVPKEKQAVN